jgi:hypothetical protein
VICGWGRLSLELRRGDEVVATRHLNYEQLFEVGGRV